MYQDNVYNPVQYVPEGTQLLLLVFILTEWSSSLLLQLCFDFDFYTVHKHANKTPVFDPQILSETHVHVYQALFIIQLALVHTDGLSLFYCQLFKLHTVGSELDDAIVSKNLLK